MKRICVVSLLLVFLFLCSCGSDAGTTDLQALQIPVDVLQNISDDLEAATFGETKVICLERDGKLVVHISITPAVLEYELALNMEPTIILLKAELETYDIELAEYKIEAWFYKNGQVDNIMQWVSDDMETGEFTTSKNIVSHTMTAAEVYELCEYTAGEYKLMPST